MSKGINQDIKYHTLPMMVLWDMSTDEHNIPDAEEMLEMMKMSGEARMVV